jgi:hypothetical protein
VTFEQAVFAGIITIIAALISALMSYANLIIGKDQKTSEFRQAWIDAIRSDVAKYAGLVANVATITDHYKTSLDETEDESIKKEFRSTYFKSVNTHYQKITELSYLIKLRLNSDDDAELITRLEDIERLFLNATENMTDIMTVEKRLEDFVKPFKKMLGDEWQRVKKGEPSFYYSKYILIFIMVSVILYFIGAMAGLWDFSGVFSNIYIRPSTEI